MSTFAIVLRSAPADRHQEVAQALSRAFSLKDSTCVTIVESAPIILVENLSREQAAAAFLAMGALRQSGAELSIDHTVDPELPKIEWPREPLIFKQSLATLLSIYEIPVACPDCTARHPLLSLVANALLGGADTDHYTPQDLARGSQAQQAHTKVGTDTKRNPPTRAAAYRGSALPEITPFSNPVLPSMPHPATKPLQRNSGRLAASSASKSLDEIFPDDDGGILPDSGDITNLLDRLLPDEQRGGSASESNTNNKIGSGGYAVFLSKIADEGRRKEAVPLIAELSGISSDEAEALSKKVIIPVVRGVTKDQAEQVKHRFAAIKVLARIKEG